jgi:GNAT superfamily N-acetyltransferase
VSTQPQPKEGFIVAEAGDEVVGFIYAAVRSTPLYGDDFEPDAGWVSVFFVHPTWRRQARSYAAVWSAIHRAYRGRRQAHRGACAVLRRWLTAVPKDSYRVIG